MTVGLSDRLRGAHWRRRGLTALKVSTAVVLVCLVVNAISGYFLLANAESDVLDVVRADAIVVLGGEHDGREEYGLDLATLGVAGTVVMSNPYDDWDPLMKRVCRKRQDVEVLCVRPDSLTTRGEALMMRQLSDERSWNKIVVLSSRFHLLRARLVFGQCYSSEVGTVAFAGVPRRYDYSPLEWELIFAYQWGGLAKALAQGKC